MTSDPSPTAPVDPVPMSPRPERRPPLGRLVRPADFERVLGTPIRLRSAHFALHHLEGAPLPVRWPGHAPVDPSLSTDLSTGDAALAPPHVDDSGRWLGLVVPKRFAQRSVTRSLLKRQIRNVAAHCGPSLPPGCWVARLRSPFDPSHFRSAASDALRAEARAELLALFARAVRGERDAPRPRRPREEAAGPGRQKKGGSAR